MVVLKTQNGKLKNLTSGKILAEKKNEFDSEKIKELAGQISDLNKEIEQKEKEITDAGQNKNNEVAKKEAIEKELKTLKDKLKGTSIEELQSKLSEKNLAKETLINAFNISTSFLEQQKNKEKYTQDFVSSV